ncbi:Hypothetical protein A7982_08435 [Minicystis rosea]|nr:Hypothetical protein A7982_08435 [Minicystis rosea]
MLCGRRRAPGEDDASACAACGEPPPEVRWQSMESYKPGQRAGLVIVVTVVGLGVSALALAIGRSAFLAPSFDGSSLVKLGMSAILLFASGILFWAGGYTLFIRAHRFESADERVFGELFQLGGRVWKAFGMSYGLRPIDVAGIPGAASLTSASAWAANPSALCAPLIARGETEHAHATDFEHAVATAAILGMAARGEIELLLGEPRRYWIGQRPEQVSPVRKKIWVRARGGAPSLAFERLFRTHLDAVLASDRAPAPSVETSYRVAAPSEPRTAAPLEIVIRMLELARDGHSDIDFSEYLRGLFSAEEPASDEGIVAAVKAMAARDPAALTALAIDVLDGGASLD